MAGFLIYIKAQEAQLGGVSEPETDNGNRERNPITSGGGSGLSGQIFLTTCIRRCKAAIATRSRKEEIGGASREKEREDQP
jgi:hypothetical protein